MSEDSLTVACLCAEWCGTCREYRAVFQEIGRASPGHRFVWIDIEQCAEQMGDVDVENFPTLLISRAGRPLFFGTVLPHGGHLARLVESLSDSSSGSGAQSRPGVAAETLALARRLEQAAGEPLLP